MSYKLVTKETKSTNLSLKSTASGQYPKKTTNKQNKLCNNQLLIQGHVLLL